jgi:hypothetical protein
VRSLLDRPRVALEGGFLAAMFLVVPFGTLHHGSVVDPSHAIGAVRATSSATAARLSILAHTAWGAARGFVVGRVASVASAIEPVAGSMVNPRETPSGTFSSPGASGPTSGTPEERRR